MLAVFFSSYFVVTCITATEEDSPDGVEEILAYYVGLDTDSIFMYNWTRYCTKIFDSREDMIEAMVAFSKARNYLWAKLDFNTLVSLNECLSVFPKLRKHDTDWFFERKPQDLELLSF